MYELELYSPILTLIKEGKLMASWCTMHLWWAATLWFSDTSNCPHSLSWLVLQKAHFRRRTEAPFLCPDMTTSHTLHLSSVLKTKKRCNWTAVYREEEGSLFLWFRPVKKNFLSFVCAQSNRWLRCMFAFFWRDFWNFHICHWITLYSRNIDWTDGFDQFAHAI